MVVLDVLVDSSNVVVSLLASTVVVVVVERAVLSLTVIVAHTLFAVEPRMVVLVAYVVLGVGMVLDIRCVVVFVVHDVVVVVLNIRVFLYNLAYLIPFR